MAEQINANCSICGRGYRKCLSCKDNMKLRPWQLHTDTSEHYKIYQALHGYNTRMYTKEETKLRLQKVDLSDLDSLRENIKDLIKDIMGVEEQEAVVKEVEVQEVVEEIPVVEKQKTRKRKSSEVVETENIVENITVPTE